MYGPHDISKHHAQPGELARCKTCGFVVTEDVLRSCRKGGYLMYLLAAAIAIPLSLGAYFSPMPDFVNGIGALLVTMLIVFGGANMDLETLIGKHANGPN